MGWRSNGRDTPVGNYWITITYFEISRTDGAIMTSNGDSRPRTDAFPGDALELDVVTVENDEAPDECAIFPRNADEDELMTTWISAHEESFVSLESMR